MENNLNVDYFDKKDDNFEVGDDDYDIMDIIKRNEKRLEILN